MKDKGQESQSAPKRRRVDEVDELVGLREKVRRQENMEELRGWIVCPVCFQVPRQRGPVPV